MAIGVNDRLRVNGTVDGFHLFACHVVGRDKGFLAQTAYHRERCIEHHRCLDGPVDVLVGIADGDGACTCRDAATDAHDGQRNHHQQGDELGDIILESKAVHLEAWLGVAAPKDEHQHNESQYKIPMVQELGQDDGGDIALVGELAEYRDCRAPARVLEIDGIHQVARHCDGVGDDEQPLQCFVEAGAFFEVKRQEHEHQVQAVDIEQRRRVKYQCAVQSALEQRPGHIGGKGGPVLGKERHAREHPHEVGHQHVQQRCPDIAMNDPFPHVLCPFQLSKSWRSWSMTVRLLFRRGTLRWPPSLPVEASHRSNSPSGAMTSVGAARKMSPWRLAS